MMSADHCPSIHPVAEIGSKSHEWEKWNADDPLSGCGREEMPQDLDWQRSDGVRVNGER